MYTNILNDFFRNHCNVHVNLQVGEKGCVGEHVAMGITHDEIAGAGVVRETHTATVIMYLQHSEQKLHRRTDIAIATPHG